MSNEIENTAASVPESSKQTYTVIRNSVIAAQGRIYTAVNSAMVQAYREIGEQIYLACGGSDRAEYGKGLLKFLSEKLTAEFGKGFTVRNLRNMRQFYMAYPKRHTVCTELSWSHYRVLMRIDDEKRRNRYTEECARSGWMRNRTCIRGVPGFIILKEAEIMIGVNEACRLVLQRSGQKYIGGIIEFEDKYNIGIVYEDGNTPDGFSYCVNKSTGEVGTVGSYTMMFEKHDGIVVPRRVPNEFRCPNYRYYRDHPE